jgi:ribosomal protein S18 acetylase RimI-like enzyme
VPAARYNVGPRQTLPWALLLYAAVSFAHFAHNAEYLRDYPNLPATWSKAEVYGAWCALTAFGVVGFAFYRRGLRLFGLGTLAVYALTGFAGLLHYTRAPLTHHSIAMNLTIWCEAAAGVLLLINVVALWRRPAGAPVTDLQILEVDPQSEAARALLAQAAAEVRPLYPHTGDAAPPANAPLAAREVYLVAVSAGRAVACGALRTLDATSAELCRLYVRPDSRCQGLGRALLTHLLERAAQLGYRRVRLETGNRQRSAMALYERLGFERIAPFGVHVGDPTSVCYELELNATTEEAGRC